MLDMRVSRKVWVHDRYEYNQYDVWVDLPILSTALASMARSRSTSSAGIVCQTARGVQQLAIMHESTRHRIFLWLCEVLHA